MTWLPLYVLDVKMIAQAACTSNMFGVGTAVG